MRKLPAIFAALPSLGVAATFLITWIRPTALGDNMVQDLLCMMMLEFVMMHAGTFLSAMPLFARTRARKVAIVAAIGLAYSVFGVGLPLVLGAPWLIAGFGLLIAEKIYAATRCSSEPTPVRMMSWGAGILLYMLFVATAALMPFPRFGITAETVRLPGGGGKFDDPHCILAAGMLYWIGMAATNYFVTMADTDATAPAHAVATAASVSP